MDLLSSYGADSDGDESVHEAVATSDSIKPGNSQTQLKTKKLDVSILPLAIQNALLRGDNMDDSDESDSDTLNKQKDQEMDSSANKSAMAMLLGSLPKPKNNFPASKLNQVSVSTSKTSSFVHSYDTTTVSTNSKTKEPVTTNDSVEVSASLNNKPISVFTLPEATSNVHDVINSAYQFDANPTFQYSAEYLSSATTMHMNNAMHDDDNEVNVPTKRRRRDLEKLLVSGDTSVMEGNDKVIDINGMNVDWNKQSYVDQQSFKRQILNKYNISDGSGISKSQSRTHHINSLVAKAAQTEIKIMEKSLRR